MTKQKHFILIRGLIQERGHWGPFLDELKSAFPEAAFHFLDIPGNGTHYRSRSPLSIKGMVEEMRRELKNLPEGERIVMGHSLGAMVATEWNRNHKEDFHRMILINTSFGIFSPFWHRLKLETYLTLLSFPYLSARAKQRSILKLVCNHPEKFDETLEMWTKIEEQRPVHPLNGLRQLWAAFHFREGKMKPDIPTLILCASKDKLTHAQCSKLIAHNWGVDIKEHPTSGHDLMVDDPLWVVEHIRSWLISDSESSFPG